MKKKNLKSLSINKKSISNLTVTGGTEVSERRTNCEYCPGTEPEPCYTAGGVSCGSICLLDPYYSLLCSNHFFK